MYYKKVNYKGVLTRDHWARTRIKGVRASTEFIELYEDGRLQIRKGYGTDFASGPTFDDKRTRVPAVEHDAKYQLMRLGLLPLAWREVADQELRDGIKERYSKANVLVRGFGSFRSWYYFEGVDHFAAYAAKYGTEPKEEFVE